MNRYSYKNLNVYQDAKAFVVAVYKLLDTFLDTEKFALQSNSPSSYICYVQYCRRG